MSLRTKLIAAFFLLAVAPLIAIGLVGYLRSTRALRALLERQTSDIAARVAAEVAARYAQRESDLLLLGENVESQRLLQARAGGTAAERAAALAAADTYLRSAWSLMARSYERVELRDAAGAAYRLGDVEAPDRLTAARGFTIARPIADQEGRRVGTIVALVRREALLPGDLSGSRVGRSGYTMVLDRATGEVAYHPRHTLMRMAAASLLGPSGWNIDTARLARATGSLRYVEDDTTRVASFVSLAAPRWTVISSAAADEFATPFVRTGQVLLAFVLLVTALAASGFVLLARRATESLQVLTAAADEVGRGNFEPRLPRAGEDEVGRLTTGFALMVAKVRAMLHEVETSRHMAAVGAFAAQVSHEIRNPLTSIKLNLQRLERVAATGGMPEESRVALGICLREIERLDRVVRGVLALGRERPALKVSCAIHDLVGDALAVVRAQLDQQHVEVATAFGAPRDQVLGEPEQLKSVFLNLFLNAAEAMPNGGRLDVTTAGRGDPGAAAPRIRVRVADTGSGIPANVRDKIFQPFYSTKAHGSGFGLPLALRTIEEHGGRLTLVAGQDRGAVFEVELPVVNGEAAA